MKTWIKYGLANAVTGFLIGLYVAITAIGDGYYAFPVAIPLASFIVGGFLWKKIVRDEFNAIKIIITGLLTGTVYHYVTFVLISIGMNICYWTTGKCTGSLGDPPANILTMLAGSFVFSIYSLLFFGWITVPYAVLAGLILKRLHKK